MIGNSFNHFVYSVVILTLTGVLYRVNRGARLHKGRWALSKMLCV